MVYLPVQLSTPEKINNLRATVLAYHNYIAAAVLYLDDVDSALIVSDKDCRFMADRE
jgi:hypothetical protein